MDDKQKPNVAKKSTIDDKQKPDDTKKSTIDDDKLHPDNVTDISAFINKSAFKEYANTDLAGLYNHLISKSEKYSNKLTLYAQRVQDLEARLDAEIVENKRLREENKEKDDMIDGWRLEPTGFLIAVAEENNMQMHPQVKKGLFRDNGKARGSWKTLGQYQAPRKAMINSPTRFPLKIKK